MANLVGFQPYMEYAGSYALYNYRLLDPALGLTYDNIAPIRAFENGLDRTSSEAGFVLTHVDMVKESPELVAGAMNTLKGAEHYLAYGDKQLFKDGLKGVVNSLTRINRVLESLFHYILIRARWMIPHDANICPNVCRNVVPLQTWRIRQLPDV